MKTTKNRLRKLKSLDEIKRGDILYNRGSGSSYVVIDAENRIAVRTVRIDNVNEWQKVKP